MANIFNRIIKGSSLLGILLILNSCILDEFKFNEIELKDEWNMELVSPLLYGSYVFEDLIRTNGFTFIQPNEEIVKLKYPTNSEITIPTRIVFEQNQLIQNADLSIDEYYGLESVNLEYSVLNGSPFPLNIQIRYFNKISGVGEVVVLPPSFSPAIINGSDYKAERTIHKIPISDEELYHFFNANKVEVKTWFNRSDLIVSDYTLLSDYPIEIRITLYGKVKIEK